MAIQVEMTDLFGGECNYNWVKRLTIEDSEMSIRKVLKVIREEFGISERLWVRQSYSNDFIQYKRVGFLHVINITWEY
jgi:hypothetical protein